MNTSTTPKVQYTYDTTTSGSVFSAQQRLQTVVYPNSRVVYYDYGTSGSAYDVLSQVRTIWDTSTSGTALATYDYNGAGSTLALTTLPQPSLKLDYFQGTSGTQKTKGTPNFVRSDLRDLDFVFALGVLG